ncbi:MAG: hypothetical protein CL916_10625 [Deltaproteobacteria bacterium]|nr:hypothetical protein [Deltaproteobacteria bacterium]
MKIKHSVLFILLLTIYNAKGVLNVTANCPCLAPDSAADDIFIEAVAPSAFLALNASSRALYGITCAQHDVSSCEPIEQQGTEPFCLNFWCYVDESCVGVESQLSRIRRSQENVGRRYSYAACGDIDRYSTALAQRELIGVNTRVMRMKNSGGWRGSYCDADGSCRGPTHALWNSVLSASQANPISVRTHYGGPYNPASDNIIGSPWSTELTTAVARNAPTMTSAFDACVYAASMGIVDVCSGLFLMTPSRESLTPFIHVVSQPNILLTPYAIESEGDIFAYAAKAFRPFTWDLWLVLIVSVVTCTVVLSYLEKEELYREERDNNPERHSTLTTPPVSATHSRRFSIVKDVPPAICAGLTTLFKGASDFKPQRVAGRILLLGLGVTLIIASSSYAANLAATLVVEKTPKSLYNSFDEVLSDHTATVCALWNKAPRLRGLGLVESRIVTFLSRSDALDAIGGPLCNVGVASHEDFEAARGEGRLCNIRIADARLFDTQSGTPVSRSHYRSLAYHARRSLTVSSAEDTSIYAYNDAKRPPDACSFTIEDKIATGLGLIDMAGPLLFMGATLLISCLITSFECCRSLENSIDATMTIPPVIPREARSNIL